jgi:hypothetical protein
MHIYYCWEKERSMPTVLRVLIAILVCVLACAHRTHEVVVEDSLKDFETSVISSAGTVKFLSDSLGVIQVIVEASAYPGKEALTKEQLTEKATQNVYILLVQHFQYMHGSVTRDSAIVRNCIESNVNRYDLRAGVGTGSSVRITHQLNQAKIGDIIRCMQTGATAPPPAPEATPTPIPSPPPPDTAAKK